MITEDFESAMKMRYLEVKKKINKSSNLFIYLFQPIVGFRLSNGNLPFKTTTAAGTNHREVHCIDDHELQLDQVICAPLPKIPLDVSIRSNFYFWEII